MSLPTSLLPRAALTVVLAATAHLAGPPSAYAQVPTAYVVAHGDSLSLIAQRLNVPVRVLAHRNHLEEPYALRTGQTLRVPLPAIAQGAQGAQGTPGSILARTASTPTPVPMASVPSSQPSRGGGARPAVALTGRGAAGSHTGSSAWGRVRHPGLVSLLREYNNERSTVNLRRPTPTALRHMRRFLRFVDGASHDIDPRLMRQLAVVSDHFGGHTVHVISGFRPFRHGQWTAHSNHNVGHAIDFRVEGVPNRVARDFCRTFPNTGCGYYPRSVFIHMDTRTESATWVDWSRPGQRPQYGSESHPPAARGTPAPTAASPGDASAMPGGADEELDDVVTDTPSIRTATPDPDPESPPSTEAVPPSSTQGSP